MGDHDLFHDFLVCTANCPGALLSSVPAADNDLPELPSLPPADPVLFLSSMASCPFSLQFGPTLRPGFKPVTPQLGKLSPEAHQLDRVASYLFSFVHWCFAMGVVPGTGVTDS